MAEVQQGGGGGKGKHQKGPKQKKKSTRIDMTAMVDVAFLLLTFFVLTTTMAQPKKIKMEMPPKKDPNMPTPPPPPKVKPEKVLTLLLGGDNEIFWYIGEAGEAELKTTNYSSTGLRKVIQDHIKSGVKPGVPLCRDVKSNVNCWDPIVVYKPLEVCRYENFVDLVDEVAIIHPPKFSQAQPTAKDTLILDKFHKKY